MHIALSYVIYHNRSSIIPFVLIFDQISSLQTTIDFMEKTRLKEESLVLVFWFCLYSEIYTGDDLQQSAYNTIY